MRASLTHLQKPMNADTNAFLSILSKRMLNYVKTLFTLGAIALTSPAFSYMIENNTQTGTFYGQFCAACWHGTIPEGETRGCPGNAHGCRNTTWIYRYIGTVPAAENTNFTDTHCYVTGEVPVTSHGKAVFNKDGMLIYDDNGSIIYQGEYYYYGDDGPFQSLVFMTICKRFKRWMR